MSVNVREAFSFDDVLLVPKYSDIATRADISLEVDIGTASSLKLPVFAAPMDTIMSNKMARTLHEAGAMGVMHRYCSIEEQVRLVSGAGTDFECFAAVGVTGDYLERAMALADVGVAGICVDVAHGHHSSAIAAVTEIRRELPDIHIMAGNVATIRGFEALADAGANSVRVGVGGGSICSTRIQTGHGVPTLQSVMDCAVSDRDCLIIADGGIKTSGDMVKALAAGADAVMVGRMLAGTSEAPGEVIQNPGSPPVKVYRGMASPEAQIAWRGRYSSNEGVSRTVPLKGSAREVLFEIDKGIRSGLSYSGARTISQLWGLATFVFQSSAGAKESSTHIDS